MSNFPTSVDDNTTLPNVGPNSVTNVTSHSSLHDNTSQAVIALEDKVGTSASTPSSSNPFFMATGTGTSAWSSASTASSALGLGSLALLSVVNLTSNVTGTLPVANGGTGVTSAAALTALVGNLLFPVGALYTSTASTNPSTALGFGTWTAYAQGQVLVGVGTSDQTFTAGATGGESDHTLTITEMPAHGHAIGWNNTGGYLPGNAYDAKSVNILSTNNTAFSDRFPTGYYDDEPTGFNQETGGGGAHNNLQPYVVVYIWERTA